MSSRFMMSVAAAALIAGSGFAFAQGAGGAGGAGALVPALVAVVRLQPSRSVDRRAVR
jgi:uncharacterized membrane protein YfcA